MSPLTADFRPLHIAFLDRYASIPASRKGEEEKTLTLLSVNRYERKKNLGLVIDTLALLRERVAAEVFAGVRLIIAGGYDERWRENRETLRELQVRVRQLGLDDQVVFKRSFTDAECLTLLSSCVCVVYTPENEHFGIVPLKAMAAGRPVVAVNKGGPLETILRELVALRK